MIKYEFDEKELMIILHALRKSIEKKEDIAKKLLDEYKQDKLIEEIKEDVHVYKKLNKSLRKLQKHKYRRVYEYRA